MGMAIIVHWRRGDRAGVAYVSARRIRGALAGWGPAARWVAMTSGGIMAMENNPFMRHGRC
jgi:hypothetical protein